MRSFTCPKFSKNVFRSSFCVNISLLVLINFVNNSVCDRRQFDLGPDIPSHLPAPSEASAPEPPPNPTGPGGVNPAMAMGTEPSGGGGPGSVNSNNFGGSGPFGFFAGNPPIPPPQNVPVGPGAGPLAPGILPEDFVPFGLNHVILILVPQFKTKFRKLPAWLESSVKIAMPITVFFDKLELGPGFPPALLPPGVLAAQAGLAAGAVPPTSAAAAAAAAQAQLQNQPLPPGYAGQYTYPGVYPYVTHDDGDDDDDEDAEEEDNDGDDDDSYENYYAEDRHNTQRRRRRDINFNPLQPDPHRTNLLLSEMDHTLKKNRNKRSIPYNRTVHSAERATLLPRLENILDSAGLGGKSCLLRAVCEVHEAPLHHYGLLGEMLTMFFSVSRSKFAESHLPEYLRAERIGKSGDCSQYQKECEKTMFSWVETEIYTDADNLISDDYW